MGIVSSVVWILSGVYLALGLIYLRFWWKERLRLAYLAFTIPCFSSMIFAWFEIGMMKASTPEEYFFYAWWSYIPGNISLIAFGWFAYLHLHGRKWLFVTYFALRMMAFVVHFAMENGLHFLRITSVGHTTILGETLSYPVADPNPWMLLPHLTHVLLAVFFLDSSLRCWRRGEARTAIIFGTGTILFAVATLIVPTSVLWGLIPIPIFGSFAVFFIVASMLSDLNYDMHRAAMLSEKLEEREILLTDTLDQLQMAASAGNVGIWIRSIDGEVTWASEKAGEIWGFPGGVPFTQDDLIEKLHPDDHERVMACVRALGSGKEEYRVDFRILGADGKIRWVQSQGRIETVDGEQSVRGAIVDITDLKTAEARLTDTLDQLQERDVRLTETLDQLQLSAAAANVGMWTRKIGEDKVWLSEKAGEIWGFPRGEQFKREEFFERIHPDDRELFFQTTRELEEGKDEFQVEYRLAATDGNVQWIYSRGKVEPVAGERFIRGAIVDITKLKKAQEAVQESETRFRNMANTAPVMIWVSDEKQATTYVNDQWLQFTGGALESELGSEWTKYLHADDLGPTVTRGEAAFAKRVPFELEFRLRRGDGEYRWVISSGAPRFSSEGEFLGYIGTSVDITDRKESERALKQAHDELNELKNQLEAENIYLQEELRHDQAFGDIIGQSHAMKYVLFKISQVAPTDSTVLIAGETGTGKELVAHAIHEGSSRRDRPLIKVNSAALSPSLIESELFGHEKGAFTSAGARRLGRFEVANTGTLLLDEIGELPLDLQGNLLRVLQEGEFERVGGTQTIKVDVRVIAATNRDLKQAVEKGTFREDLWYRLNIFPITSPPLRDRSEDIPLLTEHFARSFAKKFGKDVTAISPETLRVLSMYSWPGNVRELANVIERAVINLRGTVLKIQDDFKLREADMLAASVLTLEGMERDHIRRVLEDLNWRIDGPKGAARILGINPSTLRTRMRKLGISKPTGISGVTSS